MNQQEELAAALSAFKLAIHFAETVITHLSNSAQLEPPTLRIDQAVSKQDIAVRQQNASRVTALAKSGGVWPRIGGHGFRAPAMDAFLKPEYLARYKPGPPRLIYVAACEGLKKFSDDTGIPHNKVSTSAADRLPKRLRELGALQYASMYADQGKMFEEPGYDKWKTYRPHRGIRISENSPVSIAGPALRLIMPASMDARQFDKRFDELVQLGSTAAWFSSNDGRAHADRMRISPSLATRFTRRHRNGETGSEVSREIVAFRSVGDYDRLIAIIERVVLEHLGLWQRSQ